MVLHKVQQSFAAPGHGFQCFGRVGQSGMASVVRRQGRQYFPHQFLRGRCERGDRRQRVCNLVRHHADHRLPGRQFLGGKLGLDILQRNQAPAYARKRHAGGGRLQLQGAGFAFHPHDGAFPRLQRLKSSGKGCAMADELARIGAGALEQPARREVEQLHGAGFVDR